MYFAQGHTDYKGQSWDFNPCLSIPWASVYNQEATLYCFPTPELVTYCLNFKDPTLSVLSSSSPSQPSSNLTLFPATSLHVDWPFLPPFLFLFFPSFLQHLFHLIPGTMLNWRKQEKEAICLHGAHSLTLIIIASTVTGMHRGRWGPD